jgi:hypothetical protein
VNSILISFTMNKLRKTSNPPTPTTNLVARPLLSSSSTTALSKHSNLVPIPVEIQPLTASEQYWATRALKAEALLSAQESHHREVRSLGFSQDVKRYVSTFLHLLPAFLPNGLNRENWRYWPSSTRKSMRLWRSSSFVHFLV